MSSNDDRVLFLGTEDGLYKAVPEAGGYRTELVGLKGLGFIRFPAVVDRHDARIMYVGSTRGGFFRSEDGGETWESRSEGLVHRDIWSVIQHPTKDCLYVGASPASVYESTDRGETWHEFESLGQLRSTKQWTGPLPPYVSRMKCLDVTAADPDVIYGAIEEGWAVCSRDAGATWEQIDSIDHDGHMIAVMPDNPFIVIATTGKGIFRSSDRGCSWQPAAGLEGQSYTPAHLVKAADNSHFLMTVATKLGPGGFRRPEGAGAAFVRSSDQGSTWEAAEGALPENFVSVPRSLAADPQVPGAYFAGMIDGSVWISEDWGDSFRPLLTGLPQITSVCVTRR